MVQNMTRVESLINDISCADDIDLCEKPPLWLEHSLSEFVASKNIEQHEVEQTLHFIWIGDIPESASATINVWRKVNKNYQVNLWRLKSALLASSIKEYLIDIATNILPDRTVIQLQDSLFKKFLKSKHTQIDHMFIDWLRSIGPALADKAEIERRDLEQKEQWLLTHYSINYVQDVPDLFNIDVSLNFKRLFWQEVVLRNNLACASDILRLSILYKFGGIYIDCDTLPCLDTLFPNSIGPKNQEARLFDAFKSQIVLEKIQDKRHELDKEELTSALAEIDHDLLKKIYQDHEHIATQCLPKELGRVHVYKDSIRLSADRNVQGDFNNNIIASHKGSRLVKIILREMWNRYRYLEKNDLFTSPVNSGKYTNHYYERLDRYRSDGGSSQENFVTLHLSGPILILEVVLGVCYRVFNIPHISQELLGYVLYQPRLAFSFQDQTMYTLQHLDSSWM